MARYSEKFNLQVVTLGKLFYTTESLDYSQFHLQINSILMMNILFLMAE